MKRKLIILIFLFSIALFAEEVATDSLDVKPKLTFMEFGSTTCIPCVQMEEVLELIREDYPEVEVLFYDVKKYRKISKEYKIRLIPTQVILDQKGKEILRHQGYFPYAEIEIFFQSQGIEAKKKHIQQEKVDG